MSGEKKTLCFWCPGMPFAQVEWWNFCSKAFNDDDGMKSRLTASRVTALPLLFWCGSSYPRLAWWLIESALALAWLALDVHSMRGAAFSPSTASSSKPFILKLFQSQHLNCKLHFFSQSSPCLVFVWGAVFAKSGGNYGLGSVDFKFTIRIAIATNSKIGTSLQS